MANMIFLGIILMAAGVVFQLVTLPVEFDASKRAMQQIEALGIVSTDEYGQARKVLNAAALTYVAAAAVAVFELLRLVLIYTGMQRRTTKRLSILIVFLFCGLNYIMYCK